MAPLKPVKKDGCSQRLQGTIEVARKTVELLRRRDQLPSNLVSEVDTVVKHSFPLPPSTTLASEASNLDSLGCELWNAATNLSREDENLQDPRVKRTERPRLVVLLRALAFLLLDAAQHASRQRSKDSDLQVRSFRTGLKACRCCLDKGELKLALKVLEGCAEYVSAVEEESPLVRISSSGRADTHKDALETLRSDFYLLRMTHAWKSERLDLAEHFFGKYAASRAAHSANVAERAAHLCYEIGKALSKKQHDSLPVKWLERALSDLDSCDIEDLSQEANELRLVITAALVDVLLSTDLESSTKRAQELIEQLHETHGLGNRMAVQLMQVKMMIAEHPFDENNLTNTLMRLVRSAVLTDRALKTIMQAIHQVRKLDADISCRALTELVSSRLLPDVTASEQENSLQEWIEKACVTYTLFATSYGGPDGQLLIQGLEKLLNEIVQRTGHGLTPKATHAIQTLMWKAAGLVDGDVGDKWCSLLRHAIFDSAGQVNKAKIGRKAMTMAMARNDLNTAREAFFQMSSSAQNEVITRYLAFKLALRSNDYEFAHDSLGIVTKHADRDSTFLYACVLEAQQSQMRHIAVAALQAILDKQPPGVHLPSLLRCTTRLLIAEFDTQERGVDEVAEETVRVFENAVSNIPALRNGSDEQWWAEIQWWSKNAYNLAIRLCGQIHPDHLVRLIRVCTKFLECYPDDSALMHSDELKNRKSLCHFVLAAALVVMGRSHEKGSEESLQCYLEARQEIKAFRAVRVNSNDDDQERDFERRTFEISKFDLECILHLQQWGEISTSFQACIDLPHVESWDALADVVLIIHQRSGSIGLGTEPNSRMMELLDKIVNQTWKEHKDIIKAARWLRLSFSIDLAEGDGNFAFKLLEQAASMAKKGHEKSDPFPETELQWLAATSFNKAVDLLGAGVQDASMKWINGALELARYAADNGALHANLTGKKTQVEERMKEREA